MERSLSVTHLTAFDTVDQSRVGIPLETSSADDPLRRDGERGQVGLGWGGNRRFAGSTLNHLTSFGLSKY